MKRLARLCLFFQLAGGFSEVEKKFVLDVFDVDEETFEKVNQAAKNVIDELVERVLKEVS